MSTDYKSLRIAFGWSLVQHWGARAISFIVFFLLARLLSPADFGLVAIVAIITGFTDIFIDQGFSDAIVQSQDESQRFLSTAFWINIITATVLMIALLAGGNSIAILFRAPKIVPIIRILSVTLLFTALSLVQVALLRRRMDYRSLAIRQMFANLISGVISVAMAFLGFGVWSLVTQQIVFSVVATIMVWRAGGYRPALQVDHKAFYQLTVFGAKICGTQIADVLHTKLIDSLVGIYMGSIVLGTYSVGTRLGLILMQLLGSSVADVSLTHFSDLRRAGADVSAEYLKILRHLAFTSVPLFTLLAIESRNMIHILLGSKWDSAASIFTAFCGAGVVQVLIYFSSSALTALGRPGIQFALSFLKLSLYVAAFYVFRSGGIAAVAWSMSGITVLIVAPVSFVIVARLLRFSVWRLLQQLWLPYSCVFISATGALAVKRFLGPVSLVSLVFSVVIFLGIFTICCLVALPEARVLGRQVWRTKAWN